MAEGGTQSEGERGSQPSQQNLRPGERILPDGRRVRDAHFMLDDATQQEIDQVTYDPLNPITKRTSEDSRKLSGQVPINQTGRHTRGFGSWMKGNVEERGTRDVVKPVMRKESSTPKSSSK